MAKKSGKKVITVHQHPRRVAPSEKNPSGITIVDQHLRRLPGTFLNEDEIAKVYKSYERKNLVYPNAGKLTDEYKDADKYDDQIAVWTDYFNKKFAISPPIDPDVFKALIGSESDFKADPKGNKIAIGIAQITKETLVVIQDPTGEVKDFIFTDISQKDLKNPDIAIAIGARWLAWKRARAAGKLGRSPTDEEVILEYKGLLKSKSKWKDSALAKYRRHYEKLKKK